jgi:hypothetical protein
VTFVEAGRLEIGDAGVPPEALGEMTQAPRSAVLVPDAGWVDVGPGCYLPVARCLVQGKRSAQLLAENEELKARPPGMQPIIIAAWVGFGLGLLGGAVLGWQVARLLK